MKTLISRFVKDESGATAIEYGLIAAGISVAIIAVVNGLGTKLNTTFSSISSSLSKRRLVLGYERAPVDHRSPFALRVFPTRPALTSSQPAPDYRCENIDGIALPWSC